MDINHIDGVKMQHQLSLASSAKGSIKKKQEKTSQPPTDSVEIRGKDEESQQPQPPGQTPPGQEPPETPGENPAIKPHKKWLFLNYVAADCNLTKYQLNNLDQQELVGSDENTHIVAYVDVGPNEAPLKSGEEPGGTQPPGQGEAEPGSWKGCRTYYITKDDELGKLNSEVVAEYGDHVDMSNPDTLKKFVVDAIKKFPADHVALIFNDHGGGWTGAMSDDTDGDFMSIPDIKKALSEAQKETGKKLDIIGFDACLMAEGEVAYELKDVGDIMLASEESEGGPGWTYDSMLGGRTLTEAITRTQKNLAKKINVSPYEFAKVVVDVNREHNNDIPTFSATDLHSMDKVKESVDSLAKAVINTSDKQAVKDAINASENYGGGWAPYRDIRDLHHLCRNIIARTSDEKLKKAAEGVKKAVEEAVFANEVNPNEHPESRGLSIYAPTSGDLGSDYLELDFSKNSQWDEAVQSLGIKFDPVKRGPNIWPDGSARKQKKS